MDYLVHMKTTHGLEPADVGPVLCNASFWSMNQRFFTLRRIQKDWLRSPVREPRLLRTYGDLLVLGQKMPPESDWKSMKRLADTHIEDFRKADIRISSFRPGTRDGPNRETGRVATNQGRSRALGRSRLGE